MVIVFIGVEKLENRLKATTGIGPYCSGSAQKGVIRFLRGHCLILQKELCVHKLLSGKKAKIRA